jgi:hypothetical protein
MDELPMEEPPPVTLNQVVRVGFTLKRELDPAARAQGCDATFLA